MDIMTHHVGIDVSKDRLDFNIGGTTPFKVANTQEGLMKAIQRLPEGSRVHLEASGGYERLTAKTLKAAGFEVGIHNPLKARRFAQGRSNGAKTDTIDAKHLAESGMFLKASHEKSEEREALSHISRAIHVLTNDIASYTKRSNTPGLAKEAKEGFKAIVKDLKAQKKILQEQFKAKVKTTSLYDNYKLLMSVPHIAEETARVIVCEIAEDLEQLTPAQVTSYAGIVPVDNESGKSVKTAHIQRGNHYLKGALGMPALGAIKRQEWAGSLYARLRAKGKSHETALVAVMRKLLYRAVVVLKRGSPWQGEPLKA